MKKEYLKKKFQKGKSPYHDVYHKIFEKNYDQKVLKFKNSKKISNDIRKPDKFEMIIIRSLKKSDQN